MSHHEAQKIKRKLAPFMSLLLAVACMGLLASCGGGGGDSKTDSTVGINQSSNSVLSSFKNEDKIETAMGTVDKSRLTVYLNDSASNADFENKIAKNGWLIKSYIKSANIYSIDVLSSNENELLNAIDQVRKIEGVDFVKPVGLISTNSISIEDPDYISSDYQKNWNLKAIFAENAWNLLYAKNSGSSGIGVIDCGMSISHEDSPYDELIIDTNRPCSENHGMHVGGIISSKKNNKGTLGVAWGGNITYGANLSAYSDEDIYNSIENFLAKGVRIINLSAGYFNGTLKSGCYYDGSKTCTGGAIGWDARATGDLFLMSKIQKLVEKYESKNQNSSIIFIQAAGNGAELSTITNEHPKSDQSGMFATASSDRINLNNSLKTFFQQRTLIVGAYYKPINSHPKTSSYSMIPGVGTGSNYGYIIAPGGSGAVNSSDQEPKIYSTLNYANGISEYGFLSGTSQAAPHVSGVAALVLQVNPKLTASEVRDIILTNSDTVDGYRALNAEKAVRAALDTLPAPTISTITASNGSPTTADAVTFSASASSGNGTITAYSWDFGDGTAKSTEASPTHTFTTAGTFTVTLTVTDSAGKQATKQKNITVTGVAPNTFAVPATSYPGITFTNPISGQASCTFTATGTWIHDNITSIPSGPEGTGATANSTFPFSGGVTHSLIARRISNGAYLQVGASATVTLGAGEQLYFLINDTLGTYGDNSGSVNVGYSCSAISSATNQLNDTFSSNPLDTTKWNAISGAGGIQYSGTEVTFGGGSYATTQNKVTFSGSKIVVEGRFVGSANGRDTHMELIDTANGHFIQIGDTNYSDSFYLYGSGSSFNGIDSTTRILTSVAGSTSAYMDYRLTVDGNTAKIERSTSFADTTKTVTTKSVTLPISIVGRTFYLRIGTGALVNGYSPGTFDSVSVSVTQ